MVVDNDFNKWNINKLSRTKGAQGNYNGAVYIGNRNQQNINNTGIQGHYLWGNYFDATQDLNGDILTQGSIGFRGNLSYEGEYDPNDDLHGNLYIGNVEGTQGHFKYLNADILKSAEAYIKNLTVTGSAHFFELIIDKIRSVGGAIMLTPADGFELWGFNVTGTGGRYVYLWWVANDGKNGKTNMWEVGDQALCMSFNDAKVGTSSNVSNKYWWAKVIGTKYPSNPSGANMNYCWKPNGDSRNPDKVEVLSVTKDQQTQEIHHTDYEDAHPTYKRKDFELSERYCYIKTNDHTDIISNEEYYNLSSSDKGNYSYCALYQLTTPQNEVLYITEYQYNGAADDYIGTTPSVEIPAEGEPRYHLQDFAQSDCKLCFCIRLDLQNAGTENNVYSDPDSTFYVTENGNKAYVFQEGDNIIMLGNQDDVNRQNAIYLNAGGQGDSLDTELRPPFFAQYKGIGSQGTGPQGDRFNLEKRKFTWFSGGHLSDGYANNIQGNLKISTGQSVTDYVDDEVERGMQGIQGTYVTQTDFTVAMDGIQGTVTRGFQGMQGEILGVQSQISQTADDINFRVTGVQTQGIQGVQGVQGELENNYSTTTQTEAMIGVQATEITLQVTRNVDGELSKTGIDIAHKKITLDAENTEITGALSIKNAESGIILFGDNEPVISIQNQPISLNSNTTVSFHSETVIQSIESRNNYRYQFTSSCGEIKANTNYTISSLKFMNTENTDISSLYGTIKVKQADGAVRKTIFNVSSSNAIQGTGDKYIYIPEQTTGDFTFGSGSYSGAVYLDLDLTVNYNTNHTGKLTGNIDYKISFPTTNATQIGSNGVYINSVGSGNNATEAAFKITNGKMRRKVNGCEGDISTMVPVQIVSGTSYSVTLSDGVDTGFIVFTDTSGSAIDCYLPNPAQSKGKIIYGKKAGSGGVVRWSYSNGFNYMVRSGDTISQADDVVEIGVESVMWICDGSYWYQFDC